MGRYWDFSDYAGTVHSGPSRHQYSNGGSRLFTSFRDVADHHQVVLVQLVPVQQVLVQLAVFGIRTVGQGRGLSRGEGLGGHGCF